MNRTLLLDLDGTLVDSLPDLAAACNRLMAKLGLPAFDPADIRAMVGDGAAALVSRCMIARGRTASPAETAAFVDDYTAHAADLTQPYPGVAETLDALSAQGWRLAVCTNKPARPARALLDRLGLLHRFAAIGAGDTFPVRKPDPAHLIGTIVAADGTREATIMVGDHHNDILAATAAGIPSIFAAWGYGPPETGDAATARAAAFTDLPGLAAGLGMGWAT